MRKKTGGRNHRKFQLLSLVRPRRKGDDETDWFMLEADLSGSAAPRKGGWRPSSAWIVRLLGIACLCVSIPLGGKWIHRAIFYENEEFVLRTLNVQTDGMLSVAKLTEVANVSVGLSLLELDLEKIQARIEKVPVVSEVVVSREMPDKLNVMVRERVPVAWLSCPPRGIRPGNRDRGFLVDQEGVLFRSLDLTDRMEHLPVIETYSMGEPVEGEVLALDGAKGALEVLGLAERLHGHEGLEVDVIRLRSEWSLQVAYRNGMQVTYALGQIERGVEDLATILEQTKSVQAPLATVNLAVHHNIPVTFSNGIAPDALHSIAKPRKTADKGEDSGPQDAEQKHLHSILKGS
jgi:cell division septal protein FtsQ